MSAWKLNDSNFSFIDRFKIAEFVINPKNFWTMNKKEKNNFPIYNLDNLNCSILERRVRTFIY